MALREQRSGAPTHLPNVGDYQFVEFQGEVWAADRETGLPLFPLEQSPQTAAEQPPPDGEIYHSRDPGAELGAPAEPGGRDAISGGLRADRGIGSQGPALGGGAGVSPPPAPASPQGQPLEAPAVTPDMSPDQMVESMVPPQSEPEMDFGMDPVDAEVARIRARLQGMGVENAEMKAGTVYMVMNGLLRHGGSPEMKHLADMVSNPDAFGPPPNTAIIDTGSPQ